MTNYGKIFADELITWLIYETGFTKSQSQISIYHKYSPDGSKLVVLSQVDECVNLYKSEELGNQFLDTLEKIFYISRLMHLLGQMRMFLKLHRDWQNSYDSIIWMMLYLESNSRPAIYLAVHMCEQFTHNIKKSHDMDVKRICRYIKRYQGKQPAV